MKENCVGCGCKLCPSRKDYEERGNWCAWCDNRCTVTKKPDISFFINIAKAL